MAEHQPGSGPEPDQDQQAPATERRPIDVSLLSDDTEGRIEYLRNVTPDQLIEDALSAYAIGGPDQANKATFLVSLAMYKNTQQSEVSPVTPVESPPPA